MIKLKKLTADVHQPGQSDSEFVTLHVKVVKDTDTLLGTEEEVTSLPYLWASLSLFMIDQKAFRSGVMRLEVNAGGFSNLSAEEKSTSAAYFATAGANIASEVPDLWDRVENGLNTFHTICIESREKRMRWCESLIYNTILTPTATAVIDRIIAPVSTGLGSLWSNYIRYGREGTVNGDPEGVLDYVNSQAGTSFETNGLLEDITGNTNGALAESEIIQRINDCIQYGIYYKP